MRESARAIRNRGVHLMDFIVEILIAIKRFILVYICAVFGLMMGYFLFIVMLFPLWCLLEAVLRTNMPFHTIGNTLYIPIKEVAIIAVVVTIVFMIKFDWDG